MALIRDGVCSEALEREESAGTDQTESKNMKKRYGSRPPQTSGKEGNDYED